MPNLASSSSRIRLPLDPEDAMDSTTKQYTDNELALKVSKAGDTLSGPLLLYANPVLALEAVPKQYLDAGNIGSEDLTTSGVASIAVKTTRLIAATSGEKTIGIVNGLGAGHEHILMVVGGDSGATWRITGSNIESDSKITLTPIINIARMIWSGTAWRLVTVDYLIVRERTTGARVPVYLVGTDGDYTWEYGTALL